MRSVLDVIWDADRGFGHESVVTGAGGLRYGDVAAYGGSEREGGWRRALGMGGCVVPFWRESGEG